MFKIVSQLKLCGVDITDDDMLEKTYSTFHATNIVLQQQYREKGFKKYSELISCLLVAEQNNELLMKNHETRPTGSTPFPEVNAVRNHDPRRDRGRGRGRGHYRGHSRKYDHGRRDQFGPYNRNNTSGAKNVNNHPKWIKHNGKRNTVPKNYEDICYRCGMKGHWSRICRTAKHLVDLYQASIEGKGKNVEANFTTQNLPHERNDEDLEDNDVGITHLDVADFFEHPEGRIDHLIGDGSVQK
jgi:hypothetical protein